VPIDWNSCFTPSIVYNISSYNHRGISSPTASKIPRRRKGYTTVIDYLSSQSPDMSRPFPYTYISCPCADTPVPDPARKRRSRESPLKANSDAPGTDEKGTITEDEEEEQTFDPRSPRSNFSLYPPEQLLYCEDCHQIKCPRCITEEIVCWYCPNCLFETPSSMVRSEGNR